MSDSTGTKTETDQVPDGYEPARGSVPQELDLADGSHPVKDELGESSHRELEAHEGTLGERFAFRYGRADEAIREYLANAETGCIRSARYKLTQYDSDHYDDAWFESRSIPQILNEAREVCDYYPIIETHASPSGASEDRFRIEDNGIGISIEEFVVLKNLGLSASHDQGDQLGSFGQGVMSIFNAIGKYGEGTLSTWSRIDGANYRERFRITGFNDLPGKRSAPGTTWSFASFSEEASDLDVAEAIEKYTTAMYVPVLHHQYNEDGSEEYKEEYTYSPLDQQLLDEDDTRFVYEDDDVEVVMSPEIDDPQVYLVSQPIEAGCNLTSFDAPHKFHVRIKNERGAIYTSTRDEAAEGLVPVSEARYENELINDRGAMHPAQTVPGDIIGYEIDGYDTPVVPAGSDDDLIQEKDGVSVADLPNRFDTAVTDPDVNPKIVSGPNEGTDIVSEETWREIESDVESTYINANEINRATTEDLSDSRGNPIISGVDVVAPEPVDDRDRLESNDGSFYHAVSVFVAEQLKNEATMLFGELARYGFDQFFEFDDRELDIFTIAFSSYVSRGREDLTDQVTRRAIDEKFDISIDGELAEQLSLLSTKVGFAPRSTSYPNKKRNRRSKSVTTVLQKAGTSGTVYMGSTIHADKAKLAWEIDDTNQIVSVDNASMYDKFELLGWVPLRELDLRGIQDKYDVSDDVAAQLERDQRSSYEGYEGYTMDELEAETREIKLRSESKGSYKSSTPKEIKDELRSDSDSDYIHDDNGAVEHLLVFKETEVSGISVGSDVCVGTISRTIVPNYVAEYLEDVDGCYLIDGNDYRDAIREIEEEMKDRDVEAVNISSLLDTEQFNVEEDGVMTLETDVSITDDDNATVERETVSLGDLGPQTIGLMLPDDLESYLSSESSSVSDTTVYKTILESLIEEDVVDNEYTRIVRVDSDMLAKTRLAWDPVDFDIGSPDLVFNTNAYYDRSLDYESWSPDDSIKIDLMFPKDRFDRDSSEWENLVENNERSIRREYDKGVALKTLLHRLEKFVPEDEPVLPDKN